MNISNVKIIVHVISEIYKNVLKNNDLSAIGLSITNKIDEYIIIIRIKYSKSLFFDKIAHL